MSHPVLRHLAASVRKLSPYQPGRPLAEVAREKGITDVIKLASNENPLGAGGRALAAIRGMNSQQLGRYPDSSGGALRQKLARQLAIDADGIVLGNGSNDILELSAQLVLHENAKAVFSQHAFIVYSLATATRRAEALIIPAGSGYEHDLEAMAAAAQTPDVRLLFVANPNNPTGTWHPPSAIRRLLSAVPNDVLVVLDEAYCEYLPDGDATLSLLPDFPNLLITRTFSKIHGLAGLRAGYGVGAPELVRAFNRVRQPFNINAAAQLAAVAALEDDDHLRDSRTVNADGMKTLAAAFAQQEIPYLPSYANFITFRPANAATLYNAMLDAGVIIRQLREYDMADWLRVSVGTEEENEKFRRLLRR